jgi:hypothetical protein
MIVPRTVVPSCVVFLFGFDPTESSSSCFYLKPNVRIPPGEILDRLHGSIPQPFPTEAAHISLMYFRGYIWLYSIINSNVKDAKTNRLGVHFGFGLALMQSSCTAQQLKNLKESLYSTAMAIGQEVACETGSPNIFATTNMIMQEVVKAGQESSSLQRAISAACAEQDRLQTLFMTRSNQLPKIAANALNFLLFKNRVGEWNELVSSFDEWKEKLGIIVKPVTPEEGSVVESITPEGGAKVNQELTHLVTRKILEAIRTSNTKLASLHIAENRQTQSISVKLQCTAPIEKGPHKLNSKEPSGGLNEESELLARDVLCPVTLLLDAIERIDLILEQLEIDITGQSVEITLQLAAILQRGIMPSP